MVRYRNMDGSLPNPTSAVFKWGVLDRLMGRRAPNTAHYDVPRVANDGAALRGNTSDPLLTWVGHATWFMQLQGVNLLVDPIWASALGGGMIRRRSAPGVTVSNLPRTDVVLVTHNHRDHMDAPSLRQFTKAHAVVPMGLGKHMRSLGYTTVTQLEWWQSVDVGGVKVTLVPSQHWSRRSLADTNESLWGGFVVEGGGKRVYHSGDTAYFDGFKEISQRCGSPDAALLPIGAYQPEWFMRRQHMNPEDALQAARDLDARLILPMHWGTYQLTDEWLGEPPQRMVELADADVRLQERLKLLPVGATERL